MGSNFIVGEAIDPATPHVAPSTEDTTVLNIQQMPSRLLWPPHDIKVVTASLTNLDREREGGRYGERERERLNAFNFPAFHLFISSNFLSPSFPNYIYTEFS